MYHDMTIYRYIIASLMWNKFVVLVIKVAVLSINTAQTACVYVHVCIRYCSQKYVVLNYIMHYICTTSSDESNLYY